MTNQRPPRLIDYHMHTGVTVDARMTEESACERALSLGIHEIAFTNHIMLNQPNYLMSLEACAVHWKRIQACQERYADLRIRLGIEMDYYSGREKEISGTLAHYEEMLGRPFDIVLGSIHELNGVFFSNRQHAPELYEGRDTAALYCEYFAVAAQAVRSGLYDIMAHADLIKKHTGELAAHVPFEAYRAAVEPYIDALLETGVGIELNTKGLKLKVNEPYPSKDLLELYLSRAREWGVTPVLTLGSDAHTVDEVGGCLQEGATLLRQLGIRALTSFDGHIGSAWEL